MEKNMTVLLHRELDSQRRARFAGPVLCQVIKWLGNQGFGGRKIQNTSKGRG